MPFNQLHHVAIIASDYNQAKHFYAEILGLPILREHQRDTKQDIKLDLALAGSELELFIKPDAPERPSYPEARGLRHLAFKTTTIEADVAYLTSQGVQVEPIRTDEITGQKMVFFFDPDGLPLELHE